MFQDLKILNGDVSLTNILMLFYLLVSANILSKKISTKIELELESNILLKHILGIITLSIILNFLYELKTSELILYSVLIYFIFLLSTKISSNLSLLMLAVIFIIYYYEDYNKNKIVSIKNTSIEIQEKDNNIYKIKNNNRNAIIILIISIIGGSLLYEDKKANQFGGNFELNKFLS